MADRRSQLHAALAEAHDEILRLVDGLTAAQLAGATANPGWSGKDTLAHLSSIEGRERAQALCALEGRTYTPAEDIDTFNAHMVEERRAWSTDKIRAEFIQERDNTLKLVDGLRDDDQLDLAMDHPRRGRMTVEQIIGHMTEHMRGHAAEITTVQGQKVGG